MTQEEDSFASTFKMVLIGLVIFMIAAIILANFIAGDGSSESAKQTPEQKQQVDARIAPIGKVNTTSTVAVATPAGGSSAAASSGVDGKQVYTAACFACHGTGAAGAPKLGDKGAWSARIAQGMDTLVEHALKGFQGSTGFMPAKGGNASLSDADVKAAVEYIVSQGK